MSIQGIKALAAQAYNAQGIGQNPFGMNNSQPLSPVKEDPNKVNAISFSGSRNTNPSPTASVNTTGQSLINPANAQDNYSRGLAPGDQSGMMLGNDIRGSKLYYTA